MSASPPVLLSDIVASLQKEQAVQTAGAPVEGKTILKAASLGNATADSIIWISPAREDKQELIAGTAAGTIVCDASALPLSALFPEKTLLVVEDPRLTFIRICTVHFARPREKQGIHPSAVIHPDAVLHPDVYIGPGNVVGRCSIGAGTQIMGNCFLYDGVTVGRNVTIHAGTVIGADGFGYQRNEQGAFEKFPHLGGVVIEDDVEIGSNTCIDRGTLDDTIVRRGAKIDNLVHIAHNVVVGENSAVIALAMVGGSTQIGEGAWIAPSAVVRDGLKIGNNVTVGMGAVVTKSIPAGETWTGSPARELSAFLASQKKKQ